MMAFMKYQTKYGDLVIIAVKHVKDMNNEKKINLKFYIYKESPKSWFITQL